MATSEQLTAQIVTLNEDMARVVNRLSLAEAEVVVLKNDADERPHRRRGRRPDDDDDLQGGADAKDPHLVDRRFFRPKQIEKGAQFKEWTTDFIDYMEHRDYPLGQKLRAACKVKTVITKYSGHGVSPAQARQLYRVLKEVVLQPEAKVLVVHAASRNPWEAWRQIHEKFDPRNDSSANTIMVTAMNGSKWKCKTLQEVPTMVAKWEAVQREYVERQGEECIAAPMKRQMLKDMLPSDVKAFLEVQTMMRDELSYDQIKMAVMNLAARTNPSVAMPMDLNAFASSRRTTPGEEDAADAGWEEMDSLGKGRKGGPPLGKGSPKG